MPFFFLHTVETAAYVVMEVHYQNMMQPILKICLVFQDMLQKKGKSGFENCLGKKS